MAKKLTINAVAMGNLKHRKKQYIALVLGVVLAMIFSSGVPFFLSCSRASKEEIRTRRMGRQELVLVDAQDLDMEGMVEEDLLEGRPGYIHVLSYGWTEDQAKGTAVGWLDDRGEEVYYPQVLEGRMPEQLGEIAVERNALLRLGLQQTQPGETITLQEVAANEGEYLPQQQEKTYTLVGILDNRRSNYEQIDMNGLHQAAKVPAAFVSDQERVALGGKENLVALVTPVAWNEAVMSRFNTYCALEHRIETYVDGTNFGGLYNQVGNSVKLLTALSILLALLSAFSIANAFASNLKERKKQIGMLRAVGATRRQIIQLFGREAVLIALVCTPISVAVSYFGVKLFASAMGDYFVFLPSISVLLSGAAFGFVVVILSALIPLLVMSGVSPMQAIRDTELMRKMKNKKIRSQTEFRMDQLLAKRKMMFLRRRQVAVSLMLAMTSVILFGAVGQSIQWSEDFQRIGKRSDYEVRLNSWTIGSSSFENQLGLNDTITEAQRQEALLQPEVEQVSGVKQAGVNLLISGEYPEYLTLNEYAQWSASRFSNTIWDSEATEALTSENLHDFMQSEANPEYEEIRQWAGYEEELFGATMYAKSEDLLQKLESSVIEGTIDMEKLNAGEEIILNAPPKIGFYYKALDNGYAMGLLNLAEEHLKEMDPVEKERMKSLLAEAECPYKVGDTLTISMLVRGADGRPIRQDRTVRVGAIVHAVDDRDRYDENGMCLYTTVAGMEQYKQPIGYFKLYLNLSREVTPELDMEMQNTLEAVFPGNVIFSDYGWKEQYAANFQTEILTACALVLVLCTVSISLVNNSISAQIREGKRTIGTLRAVGASEKDIVRSYVRQILYMTGLGVLVGMAVYSVGTLIIYLIYHQTLGKFVLWPAPILFVVIFGICCCNLLLQVKKVSRQSIVENIREL